MGRSEEEKNGVERGGVGRRGEERGGVGWSREEWK